MNRLTNKEMIDFNLKFKILETVKGFVELTTYRIDVEDRALDTDSYRTDESETTTVYSIISIDEEIIYVANIPSYTQLIIEIKDLMSKLKQERGF